MSVSEKNFTIPEQPTSSLSPVKKATTDSTGSEFSPATAPVSALESSSAPVSVTTSSSVPVAASSSATTLRPLTTSPLASNASKTLSPGPIDLSIPTSDPSGLSNTSVSPGPVITNSASVPPTASASSPMTGTSTTTTPGVGLGINDPKTGDSTDTTTPLALPPKSADPKSSAISSPQPTCSSTSSPLQAQTQAPSQAQAEVQTQTQPPPHESVSSSTLSAGSTTFPKPEQNQREQNQIANHASTQKHQPQQRPQSPVSRKKKRKNGFLSNLFANLCGGSSSLEDEHEGGRKQGASMSGMSPVVNGQGQGQGIPKHATGTTAPNAEMKMREGKGGNAVAVTSAGESSQSSKTALGAGMGAGAAAVAIGATVSKGGADGGSDGESSRSVGPEVIVGGPSSVSHPGPPPIEETEGLLSSAVQAPGSGAEFLHPHHPTHALGHVQGHNHTTNTSTSQTGDSTEISKDFMTDSSELDVGQQGHGNDNDGSSSSSSSNDNSGNEYSNYLIEEEEEDEVDDEDRLISQGGIGIPIGPDGKPHPLLPPLSPEHAGRKCLVLDLDETLLHSSFKMIPSADYIVPVEIESQLHNVYVVKRPGVDDFLRRMGEIYEVVVFTASLSKYADPVLDMLDVHRVVKHRLFRESCYNHKGNYVKDLSQLGRDMHITIIIDNSPASYIFHPNNAVPVSTWFNDPHDTELTDLVPFLSDLSTVDDIRAVLDGSL